MKKRSLLSPVISWAAKKFLSRDELDDFWYGKTLSNGYMLQSQSVGGMTVTPDTATRCVAVFACVDLLSSAVAGLPLFLYNRTGTNEKQKEPAKNDPNYTLLHSRPNEEQTPEEFITFLMACRLLRGNFYVYIQRDGLGEVVNLWPLHPDSVTPKRDQKTRAIYYEVRDDQGRSEVYESKDIIHNKYFSTDGFIGLSPIACAANAIGLTMAAEQFGVSFFENGARPSGILSYPMELDPKQKKNIQESWHSMFGGPHRAGKTAVLEYGLQYSQLTINPDEAQYLELRKFQVADIARLFRIPPHMIGDVERSTSWGTGIEQQGIGFVTYSLKSHLTSIEQSFERGLFSPEERENMDIEFNVDALLRGDVKTRFTAYATGRQWGWLNVDEIRGLENMPPLPDGAGQRYLEPQNMKEAGQEEEQPEIQSPDFPEEREEKEPIQNNRFAISTESAARINGNGKRR